MPNAHAFQTDDPRLVPIKDKVLAGERLNEADARSLFMGRATFSRWVGWRTGFASGCMGTRRTSTSTGISIRRMFAWRLAGLCAFGRKKDTPGAYTMALEEAFQTAASGYSEAVTEFHIVGGLHPDLPFQYFLDLVFGIEGAVSAGAHEGFHHGGSGLSGEAIEVDDPRDAGKDERGGVDSLPGGGGGDFLPTGCGTLSATTRLTAINGWIPRAWPIRSAEVECDDALWPHRKR